MHNRFSLLQAVSPQSAIQNYKSAILVGAFLFALCSSAAAQQMGKLARIGYLDSSTASASAVLVEAFQQELSKLGWTEGKNFTIDCRFADQKNDRLSALAADLVRLKVDLILVSGGPAAVAARKATTTVPVVMANVGDLVAEGLVAGLARPGSDITGLAALSTELNTKTARDTQGHATQTRPSWISVAGGNIHRTRTPGERA